jgi:mono/diheme cytochrome c family protein
MLPGPRTVLPIALAGSLAHASIPSAMEQSTDFRFGNPALFMAQSGEGLYADLCQGCLMPWGVGAVGAGAYPALAKNGKLETAGYAVSLVINGRKGMPAFGEMLTDQQVAAVVNYVRTHFGNNFPDEVTPDDAKSSR